MRTSATPGGRERWQGVRAGEGETKKHPWMALELAHLLRRVTRPLIPNLTRGSGNSRHTLVKVSGEHTDERLHYPCVSGRTRVYGSHQWLHLVFEGGHLVYVLDCHSHMGSGGYSGNTVLEEHLSLFRVPRSPI